MRLIDAERERKGFITQDSNSPLGQLAASGQISREEYQAGVKWRDHYLRYLQSIGAPAPYGSSDGYVDVPDDECERLAAFHRSGCKLLNDLGKSVFHAVNAIAVYEEPDALGDFEFAAVAAQKGLAALANRLRAA